MRHRLANKSLSRPTAHRLLLLRNLVSSLLQHEQITTTVAKAKEAQKVAEKVIGWGKKGGKDNWIRANSFLLVRKPSAVTLDRTTDLSTLAEPYGDARTAVYDVFGKIRRSCWRVYETSPSWTPTRRLRRPRSTRARRFSARPQVRISRQRSREGIGRQIERGWRASNVGGLQEERRGWRSRSGTRESDEEHRVGRVDEEECRESVGV